MPNTTATEPDGMTDAGRIPRITPEDVLEELTDREDRAEPLTAPELAEALECSRRTALNKLHTLEEDGDVASKKVGGRSKVWWLPLTDAARDGAHGRSPTARDSADRSPPDAGDAVKAPREARDADEDPVEALALPGSGANLEGRREAVRAIYEYLKAHGSGQRSDFKDVVDVDATGYKSFNSFYTNCMDNGAVLGDLPGVRSPGEGGHNYTYTEPGEES